MKRCPQCNRVESDEALKFCRVDGTTLVSDSSSIDKEAGTVKLGSASVFSGVATDSLPSSTNADINRATAPTTVLPSAPPQSPTSDFRITTKTRLNPKALAVIVTAVVASLTAVGVISYRTRSSGAAIQSIAVMPFVNASGDAELDYLSDGMTETLIRSLSQLPNLNVKARSTVFRYKGRSDVKTIGKELGVPAILQGRFTQRGDQLTLNLELIDAQTENVIWTDQYARKSSDLVSIQNEIARDVSSRLRLKLSGSEQEMLAKNYTTDSEAYRLYLQGRFYWNKRAGPEFEKSEIYFRRSIEKDPKFALGYVGLADYYGDRERNKAKENVNRALELGPNLAEAHGTLGYQYMLDYDWVNAEYHMKRAVELDQTNLDLHRWSGQRLMMLGRYDEAFAAYDRALEIDPHSAPVHFTYGACLVASGQLDKGIEYLQNAIKDDPTFIWNHSHLSFAYRLKGDYAGAAEQRAISQELLGEKDNARLTRESFAKGGRVGFLREMIRQAVNPDGVTGGMRTASAYALLGEKEKALEVLDDSARKGDFWLFQIKYDPAYEALRGEPRFQTLLKMFNVSK
jgi:TolB-like protein/Tfp pilus assembly protein PilF